MIRWILHDYPTLDSTNDLLKELAREGAPEGTCIRASEQKKGRGRRERVWHSPTGLGLYLSWLLRPPVGFADYELMTTLSSLPVASYLAQTYSLVVQLKWPNDLILHDKKLGGVLAESGGRGGDSPFLVVGLGLNCLQQSDDYPPWLRSRAISLAETGVNHVNPADLVHPILDAYEAFYEDMLRGGKEQLLHRYQSLSCTLGKHVCRDDKQGIAIGLGKRGELQVRLPNGREEYWESP